MKAPRLARADRRAILIGLLVVAPVALAMLVVQPYLRAVGDAQERLIVERELLGRELTLVEEARQYSGTFQASSEALLRVAPRLFDAREPSLAVAALTAHVEEVALRSRVHVLRATPIARPTVDSGTRALPIELSAESDLESILTFLRALEDGQKLVRVERARIESTPRHEIPQEPGVQVLRLTAQLVGYALDGLGADEKVIDAIP